MKKMSMQDLTDHIMKNKPDYNATVIISALHKRIYGVFPAIGMSGQQGEYADELEAAMPKVEKTTTE